MTKKFIAYLVIVAVVCTAIGGITDVEAFNTIGVFGFCGAGVVFIGWLFNKFFLK